MRPPAQRLRFKRAYFAAIKVHWESLDYDFERRFIILLDCAVQRCNSSPIALSALLSLIFMTSRRLKELLQTRFRLFSTLVLFRIVVRSVQRAQQNRRRERRKI